MKNEINYTLSFSQPQNHYADIEMSFQAETNKEILVSLPVWTPGSYMVREFARHIEKILAFDEFEKPLEINKINKNTWKINNNENNKIILRYRVYCNELTVRTSQVNIDHAFLNGANIFLFVKNRLSEKCILEIKPYKTWKNISTGLKLIAPGKFEAPNYDDFIDCPIEIGNQEILEFTVSGKKHFICLAGKGNYTGTTLVKDFKEIVEVQEKMFGDLPYEDFTFIIQLVQAGGGGLEHKNSFAVLAERNLFDKPDKYRRFLGLISHEFFHTWNVKRIRPEVLGPFNYDSEVYTNMHYVTEGWTSFYDNLLLRRAGIFSDDQYLDMFDNEVNDVMRFQGRFKQSLEESSFDNWIKYYRQDENSKNSMISYYTKGALVAYLLDMEIIKATDASRSLDDVLKLLYEDYKNNPEKGYTDARIKELSEQVSGKNMDEFWNDYISGTKDLPLKEYFAFAGIDMINLTDDDKISLDVEYTYITDSVIMISRVYEGGSGYKAGLNYRDKIIFIEDEMVAKNNLQSVLDKYNIGEEIDIKIDRDGLEKVITVKLERAIPRYKLKIMENRNEQQLKFYNKLING
ncbi:MAG TPA: peptidase M61 [Ignavibacteria bacterium]|nr:peptidase M61 [Ignavibacteria bacterium]